MINIVLIINHIFQKKLPLLQKVDNEDIEVKEVKDLCNLTPEERWNVYFAGVSKVRGEFMTRMSDLLVSPL